MRRRHRASRPGNGQALVEFALLIPLILVLITGAIDLGRAVVAYNTIANAARHGARVAAVNQLDPEEDVRTCNEDMPIEDFDEPHWSARACTAFFAFGLQVTPADVGLSYKAPAPDGPLPSGVPAFNNINCDEEDALRVGCIAIIDVEADWQPITPVIGTLVGPITFTSHSEQAIERVFP